MSQKTLIALCFLCALSTAGPAQASPRDTKVGDVRAVFLKSGTALRDSGSALAKPVATLKYGTQVRVLETKLPWIRVQTVARRGTPSQTGWLRAFETVEASALARNPTPAHTTYRGSTKVDAREVSAAGRQLDAGTERRFRASRKDLERAYRAVDRMEAATQAMDPGESIAFIVEGGLGRKGRDYARPGRVAAKRGGNRNKRRGKALGGAGRIGGAVLRGLGGDDKLARGLEAGGAFFESYLSDIKVAFSPQQEYYLGRAVAAEAIAKYGVDRSEKRRAYLRRVGDAVVRLSSRIPANFGGYHFEVLDSDDVNGVSGPGGFVLLTRGAVEAAQSEAELAGVLAHELAHVSRKHGESLLRKGGNFPSMLKGLSAAAAPAVGGQAGQWAQGLLQFFGKAVAEMKTTAISHGYGKALEFDADREGTHLLFDVYYDHTAVRSFLLHMRDDDHAHMASSTHASPAARAQALDPVIAAYQPFQPREATAKARADRFGAEMGRQPALPSFGAPK